MILLKNGKALILLMTYEDCNINCEDNAVEFDREGYVYSNHDRTISEKLVRLVPIITMK